MGCAPVLSRPALRLHYRAGLPNLSSGALSSAAPTLNVQRTRRHDMRRQGVILLAFSALLFSRSAFPSASPARADEGAPARAAEGTLRAPIIDTGSVTRTAPTLSAGIVSAAADELRQEEADMASGNDGNLSMS